MDIDQPAVDGSGAALAATFLKQLDKQPQDEKEMAFKSLRDGLRKGDRYLLRRTLEVNAPEELQRWSWKR